MKFLQGKKRYLGILGFAGSKLLQALGIIDAQTGQVIEVISGGVFGVGYVDAKKREVEVLKEVARKS